MKTLNADSFINANDTTINIASRRRSAGETLAFFICSVCMTLYQSEGGR